MNTRWDETWHRLLAWTNGQGPAERLAAQLLLAEGFTDLDPSHPLGGPDGGKDILCVKDGTKFVGGVYFPRGQQTFATIQSKFESDLAGAQARPGAEAFVFVTNQELRLSERQALQSKWADRVILFHLERATAILDQPLMEQTRLQFLGIGSESTGQAGAGGAVNVTGNRSVGIGGDGGRGGRYGKGGDGGAVSVEGDDSMAIGGNGGDAPDADGRGGRGGRGPTERYGFPSDMWGVGRAGSGGDAPEYTRRIEQLRTIRSEYLNKFPERAIYVDAGVDAVPVAWVNQRLDELGESWHVAWGGEGYEMPPLV